MKILLGADPEMFVQRDGEPISAWGMNEGTKEKPLIVPHGALQVDGMALEYNIDPVTTLEEWERNHTSVQESLLASIEDGLTLEAIPTAFFSEEVFNNSPEEALILGCEPDFNAYTERINPKPDGNVPFRTGAGHIHIGWTKNEDIKSPFHLGECYALTKSLDLHLGIPSLLMDGDSQRRILYGKAGCFRPKPYGMEYRTLSNFWIKTPKLRKWAYENTMRAIRSATDEDHWKPVWIESVINNNREDKAVAIVEDFNLEVHYERV